MSKLATVYRAYAADGSLLYVGCSNQVSQRLKFHRQDKAWWSSVERVEQDPPQPAADAFDAERDQITELRPRHNRINGRGARSDGTIRATFEVPRTLVEEFRAVAKRNDRTLSGELRQLMRDAIDRERTEKAA